MNTGNRDTEGRVIYKGPSGGLYVMKNGRKTYRFVRNNNNNNNNGDLYYIVNKSKLFSKLGYKESNFGLARFKKYLGQYKFTSKLTSKYPNMIRNVIPNPKQVVKVSIKNNRNEKNNNTVNKIMKNLINIKNENNLNNTRDSFLIGNRGKIITNLYGTKKNIDNLEFLLKSYKYKVVPAHPNRYKLFNNNVPSRLNRVIFYNRNYKNNVSNNLKKLLNLNNQNVVFNYNNNNSKCEFILKKQIRGTCWAHALINSWIMSTEARRILEYKLEMFQAKHGKLNYSANSCPMKGKITNYYFWAYIDHVLRLMENAKLPRFNEKFNQNNVISNSLRPYTGTNKQTAMEGGGKPDFYRMNRLIFKPSQIVETNYKYIRTLKITDKTQMISISVTDPNYKLPRTIRFEDGKLFTIVNSMIGISIPNQTRNTYHAIAGAICNNTPIVIDSNNPVPQRLQWTDGSKMNTELQKLSKTYTLTENQFKNFMKTQGVNVNSLPEQAKAMYLNEVKKATKSPEIKFTGMYVNYILDINC